MSVDNRLIRRKRVVKKIMEVEIEMELVSVEQAAIELEISVNMLKSLIRRGDMPVVKIITKGDSKHQRQVITREVLDFEKHNRNTNRYKYVHNKKVVSRRGRKQKKEKNSDKD